MRFLFAVLAAVFCLTSPVFSAEKPAKSSKDLSKYIAVFDFDVVGKVDKGISRPLSDSVRYEIVRSRRFKVMDRANMDRILKEQAFQMTGGVQKDRAVEAGQFLGVGRIVIGSIGIVGKTYMISLSLVNIESGETELVEEDTCRCEVDELIEAVRTATDKLMTGVPVAVRASTPIPASPLPGRMESASLPSRAAVAQSGAVNRDPVTGMDLVLVKGGCFQMGTGDGDREERPVHEVCVDDFYMGKTEVTQGQWKSVRSRNPSSNDDSDMNPVEDVSWNDVQDFIRELNQRSGRYYRLPTEAEWEFAAREGGRKEKWSGANNESELDAIAWYDDNAHHDTHSVGQKRPNALGLYDMTGNVWEWVGDWYDDEYYSKSPRNNPGGPERGDDRVFRGGCYRDDAKDLRTTKRDKKSSGRSDSTIGFRLVLPVR
jgi:formylglycine-generating enzyme required for sulfatase activity